MPAEETNQDFSAGDLAHVKSDDGAEQAKTVDAGGDKGKPTAGEVKPEKAAAKTEPKVETKTIASGADAEADDKAKEEAAEKKEPDKAAQWQAMREVMAKHYSAGDEKLYKKELKRLERIANPEGLYGSFRELESRFSEGGLVKVPGKDAKPEDIAAFHKALGVPEKPEEYFADLKLENGAVVGDADKPILNDLAGVLQKAGAQPTVAKAIVNWYYGRQEEQAATLDESDDTFQRESVAELKEEWGPAYNRERGKAVIAFLEAPGGTNVKNPASLAAEILGARLPNGQIAGNDARVVRWLRAMSIAAYPQKTVTEDGNQSGMSVDDELAKIDKMRRENRPAYNKDYAMQARERELIDARIKIQAQQRA